MPGMLGAIGKEVIYFGLIVSFSSTMVVIKLLADKHELDTLHGRIIIGILIIRGEGYKSSKKQGVFD